MKLDVNSPGYVVGFTVAVAAGFTAVVMTVQAVAWPVIERNEAVRVRRALVEVFAGALGVSDAASLNDEEVARLAERHVAPGPTVRDPVTGREFATHLATGRAGEPAGVAFEFVGRGFWAAVSGILALAPDLERILGVAFLSHSETPGLGGRITEPAFQDQFRGLLATPLRGGGRIVFVAQRLPRDERDRRFGRSFAAITGATQTSMAVERLLNENLVGFRRAWAAARGR